MFTSLSWYYLYSWILAFIFWISLTFLFNLVLYLPTGSSFMSLFLNPNPFILFRIPSNFTIPYTISKVLERHIYNFFWCLYTLPPVLFSYWFFYCFSQGSILGPPFWIFISDIPLSSSAKLIMHTVNSNPMKTQSVSWMGSRRFGVTFFYFHPALLFLICRLFNLILILLLLGLPLVLLQWILKLSTCSFHWDLLASFLKKAWRQVCHQYVTKNPGKVITEY